MKTFYTVCFTLLISALSQQGLGQGCSVKIKCESGGHATCEASPALDDDANSNNNGPAFCGKIKAADRFLACSTSVPIDDIQVRGRTAQYSYVCCDKDGRAVSGIINRGHTITQSFGTARCASVGIIE